MSLAEQVAEIIIENLELEDHTPQDFPKDALLFGPPEAGGLALDSLAAMEIISGLADAFDHDFDDVERDDMMSVNAIVGYIERNNLTGAA